MEKIVVVTGGSRGIGEAICEAFIKNGDKVILNYKRLGGLQMKKITLLLPIFLLTIIILLNLSACSKKPDSNISSDNNIIISSNHSSEIMESTTSKNNVSYIYDIKNNSENTAKLCLFLKKSVKKV